MGLFSFLSKKQPAPAPSVREVLFGDVPVLDWPRADSPHRHTGVWAQFAAAQAAYQRQEPAAAIAALRQVLATPQLEARQCLQAWQFLRLLGEVPPAAEAKRVLGVVVEVVLPEGLDLLAAYADNSARYYNYSGAGVVWEASHDLPGGQVQALLAAGQLVADAIGPWEEARPAAPPTGQARLNLLTPSGLHFGQAPIETLYQDPLGSAAMQRAQELMTALMELSPQQAQASA